MIQEGFLKSQQVGRDGFVWWIGQVVAEDQWVVNIPGRRTPTTSDHLGFDYRYKVRIMGYHTADVQALPDEDLPWAGVMLPVTAGTGNGGASQTPSIRQGDFCYGFFLDGENAQHPIIMGLIGYNQYVSISKLPAAAFQPFSGYTSRDLIARYALNVAQEPAQAKQNPEGVTQQQGQEINPQVNNSNIQRKDGASAEQAIDGYEAEYLDSECEPIPMSKMQRDIKNAIQRVEKYKKTLAKWENAVSTKVNDIRNDLSTTNVTNFLDNLIQFEIDGTTKSLSEAIKWLLIESQKFITKKINDNAKTAYFNLFPNQRPPLKEGIQKASEAVVCLFRNLISNLLKMIGNFLKDAFNKFVNVPLCAVENLLGGVFGAITGLINGALNNILKPITSLLGSAFDIAGDVLDFISELLSFILCDEKPDCAKTTEWSVWDGPEPSVNLDVSSIVGKVKGIASAVSNFDIDLDSIGDVNLSGIVDSVAGCFTGPSLCGPPTVTIFGGGGSGATANAIVNSAGRLIGADIILPGSGYTSAPFVKFQDSCGKGRGGFGRSKIDDNGRVTSIQIVTPGTGYLPTFDGSYGGDGRTWANKNDTIVQRSDRSWDLPYGPGEEVRLNPGDKVLFPESDVYQDIIEELVIVTPQEFEEQEDEQQDQELVQPISSDGQYPVVLELTDIIIDSPGFSYTNEDVITVTPDNGARVFPIISPIGSIIGVTIASKGLGFTDIPEITISSQTGFNARFTPVLGTKFVGEQEITEIDDPEIITKVISVVDCVGRF